ncbi:MAG: hypothetical protein PVH61_42950 [Candidatus Aminicenantes bacterium]
MKTGKTLAPPDIKQPQVSRGTTRRKISLPPGLLAPTAAPDPEKADRNRWRNPDEKKG